MTATAHATASPVRMAAPISLEEPTVMLHFSCDICGKNLPDGTARYVVKIEAYAATDPARLTDEDLDTDHVEEMAQLLSEIEDGEQEAPELLQSSQKLRFDLCMVCSRKFVKDPLGRDNATRFDFSEN